MYLNSEKECEIDMEILYYINNSLLSIYSY